MIRTLSNRRRQRAADRVQDQRSFYRFAVLLVTLATIAGCQPGDATKQGGGTDTSADEPFPLSPEMALMEKDIASPEYLGLLSAMTNPHDRRVEYNRLDSPDNPSEFLEKHGGLDRLQQDVELRAAYERRELIAASFH